MTNISARSWVLMGFSISLISVIINVFVLSGINERIKEVDGELNKLTTSLSNQATEMTRAEVIQNFYITLNHISKFATGDAKKSAEDDSIFMLQSYLQKTYAAVNDIPTSEMKKVENEELSGAFLYLSKAKELQKARTEGNTAEVARLEKETDDLEKVSDKPKSEIGSKLAETVEIANPEQLADKSTTEIIFEISPYLQKLNEQFITNYQKKETRIKELQDKKANLNWWASIASYLAISLQLFGLMFVLTKDVTKDVKERREKADKKAAEDAKKKDEEEEERAALALIEATKAKKINQDADEVEEQIEEKETPPNAKQNKEVRDLFAELEEDLESAVEKVDRAN
jgi:hypothetical protein